jgi:hypothetical protein
MTTNKAIENINTFVSNAIVEYDASSQSKDADSARIAHPLDNMSTDRILNAIDYALKSVTISTIPLSLLETTGSTATEFKKIDTNYYIRQPQEPQAGAILDIDDSLSYAVIYKALAFLWSGFSSYNSEASGLMASHNDATRDYIMSLQVNQSVEQKTVYFRYSSDESNWHDNFVDGDVYISIRQGDGVWSNAIRFVGQDGEDGDAGTGTGGATTFVALSDTPSTLTEGKFLAVGANGTIVEVDAPSGGSTGIMDGISGNDDASGTLTLDLSVSGGNKKVHYVFMVGDLTLEILKPDGFNPSMELGVIYTLQIFTEGHTCTISDTMQGDTSIDSNAYANILQIMYDGFDIFVISNVKY